MSKTPITRRHVLAGSAGGVAALAAGLAKPALAASQPIKVGFLPALTGPASSTGIGIQRGTILAVKDINAAGGVGGRQIELITRDTQSNPSKAVDAAAELIRRQHVIAIWGPCNSGEALAVVGLVARLGVLQIHPDFVDSLTNVKKYPLSFRMAPDDHQIGTSSNRYVLDVLKLKKVAITGDTSGYGVATVAAYLPLLKEAGADVVYHGNTDPSNPNLKPELLRMRSAGAQVIMPWSVNTGFLSRIMNTRGDMGWDVPIVGQQSLGNGQIRGLLEKPTYWEKVYQQGFRPLCFNDADKLSPRTAAYVKHLGQAGIDLNDTLLFFPALGQDALRMITDTVEHVGTDSKKMAAYLNTLKAWPGLVADYTFTPENHNGYPDDDVVMCQANSFKNGTFKLAPGYST